MTLYLKIFLWFWLAMALIVGAVTLVNWSTRTEPLVLQWQTMVGEAVATNSQTAVQIYENEGLAGLETYLDRIRSRPRVNSAGLLDANMSLIAGNLQIAEVKELYQRALQTDEPEFLRFSGKTFTAKRVAAKNGSNYVFVLEIRRFQAPPFFTSRLLFQVLAVVITAGLVCYALALYLTSPISKLRSATQKFAAGDLETRVGAAVGKRRDEISALAGDFDVMAERIEALVAAEKRLTQDISHELRSPLARLNVALELARAKSNDETRLLIDRIESESNRLNEMLSRLLMLSKLETGAGDFEKCEINLTKLSEHIVGDADFEAKAHLKRVEFSAKEEIRVLGNESLLRSAVENVVRNAVRYTNDNSAVEVSLRKNAKNAVISVRDHGPGVPDQEIEKLFKPFYRLQTARDRKTGGIGLGLAIAERAVNAHNGTMTARNLEDGLIVEIELPHLM